MKQLAQRFEIYAGGIELANAFYELCDAKEQKARFLESEAKRDLLGKPKIGIEQEFFDALSHCKPTSGIALGFDRLLMLVLKASDIALVQANV